jgi:hypothetical protein
MAWYVYVAMFFAGAFAANAIPHLVQGICGNKFQTPFASLSGVGESSAMVNVIWGAVNVAISGALLHYFLPHEFPPPPLLCVTGGLGALIAAVFTSWHFSKVRNAAPHP